MPYAMLRRRMFHVDVGLFVFQDEVDSQNPILRDNHQLHEEVKGWLKDQKVQEIFMQGNLPTSPPHLVLLQPEAVQLLCFHLLFIQSIIVFAWQWEKMLCKAWLQTNCNHLQIIWAYRRGFSIVPEFPFHH